MPKLVTTITKQNDSDPWIILSKPYRAQIFSQEEINGPLKAFFEFSASLVGSVQDSFTESVNGNVFVSTREFDTVQNAEAARAILGPGSTVPEVKAKNEVVVRKMTELNVPTYSVSVTVEP